MRLWKNHRRNQLGKNLKLDELEKVPETVEYLLRHKSEYSDQIDELADQYIFNRGTSAEVGANYIIETIQEKVSKKGAAR